MSDPKDAAFVFEMHRALKKIADLIEGENRDDFLADRAKPHALAMFFLNLGEAANRVSRETWSINPQIEWQKIANLRHLIAHEYRKIDHGELWKIASADVPSLGACLPKLSPPDSIL